MKTFEDLEFTPINDPYLSGKRSRMMFKNGYGVSVVSHTHSYGGKDGLYELAVLDFDGNITYDTPITSDVLGHLSESEVTDYLTQIEQL